MLHRLRHAGTATLPDVPHPPDVIKHPPPVNRPIPAGRTGPFGMARTFNRCRRRRIRRRRRYKRSTSRAIDEELRRPAADQLDASRQLIRGPARPARQSRMARDVEKLGEPQHDRADRLLAVAKIHGRCSERRSGHRQRRQEQSAAPLERAIDVLLEQVAEPHGSHVVLRQNVSPHLQTNADCRASTPTRAVRATARDTTPLPAARCAGTREASRPRDRSPRPRPDALRTPAHRSHARARQPCRCPASRRSTDAEPRRRVNRLFPRRGSAGASVSTARIKPTSDTERAIGPT